MSKAQFKPGDQSRARVLEYARPIQVAPRPQSVGWAFFWGSIVCVAVFFYLYATQLFATVGMALITIVGLGFSTSLVAVFALYKNWKGLVFSTFGLILNLACLALLAYRLSD